MKFFTRTKKDVKTKPDYKSEENISERKTTKIGYALLFLMVVFIVWIAQTVFYDLAQIVPVPERPSGCVRMITNDNYSRSSVPSCNFSSIDTQLGIDTLAIDMQPMIKQVAALNTQINQLEDEQRRVQRDITQQERAYELSLQETVAQENVLFVPSQIQQAIEQLRGEKSTIDYSLRTAEIERTQLLTSYSQERAELESLYETAQIEYDRQYGWYRFQVFLLMLVFVVPLFGLTTKYYLKLKRANSPHTIIAGATMLAAALLFLQVVLLFLYDIIPSYWIEVIFSFFVSAPLFRYILYYGSIVVVIGVFGGIVYFIQKRIYDPVRIARRALKHGQCPGCDFSITRYDTYCANCALTLRHTCQVCGQSRSSHLPVCSNCGDNSRS